MGASVGIVAFSSCNTAQVRSLLPSSTTTISCGTPACTMAAWMSRTVWGNDSSSLWAGMTRLKRVSGPGGMGEVEAMAAVPAQAAGLRATNKNCRPRTHQSAGSAR